MKKVLAILFLVIFLISFGGCRGGKSENSDANANSSANAKPIEVKTAVAVSRDLPSFLEATGNIVADAQTDVAPLVAGKIVKVNFDVGSYVNKGEVLIRLDDGDSRIRLEQAQRQVDQQQNAVRQAKAGVAQAESSVKQSESNVEQSIANLRQTQIRLNVKDGDVFDIETFSQVRSVNAQLALAEKELTRAEKLLATGDVSKSFRDQRLSQRDALLGQLAESRSNAAVAVKAISSAQAAVNSAKQGVQTANANLGSAQQNVNSALAAVETGKVQIEQAQKAINDAVVYAPISGYISERVSDVGEFISPNTPNSKICTIVRTGVVRMRIDVPEQAIAGVHEGQGVSINVSAYPDRNFAGTIARILPNLNATARTMTAEAEIDNRDRLLRPGQFATVKLTQAKGEIGYLIPKTAVRTDGGVTKIFVVQDGRAVEKIVQLGDEENDSVQIKQGVKENEQVAISNVEKLFDGVSVRQ